MGSFKLSRDRRIVCSSEVGAYAGGKVATARVTHTRQVTAEAPDKVCPTRGV
jgi:hypothetical protein